MSVEWVWIWMRMRYPRAVDADENGNITVEHADRGVMTMNWLEACENQKVTRWKQRRDLHEAYYRDYMKKQARLSRKGKRSESDA